MPARVRAGRIPAMRFGPGDRATTYLTPPAPSSLPREREQLEFSSRSFVFPTDGERILRAWGPPERPFVVAVEAAGGRWRLQTWGADPARAREAVRQVFSLDHPISEFYRLVRREPVLRGTERRFRGLRLPRDSGLYEAILHAVLGQQLSVRAANTIRRRLFDQVAAYVDVEGTAVPRVPTPEELLGLGEAGLRRSGLSGAKARSVSALAELRRSGELDDARYHRLDSEAAVAELDALPGVGRWTAENALLRGAGRRDLFVAGDLGLRMALEQYGVVRRSAPEAAARAWADRCYPGWGSYATLYLWRRLVADRSAG